MWESEESKTMKRLESIYKHASRDEWLIFFDDDKRSSYVRIKRYGDIIEYPLECFKDRIDRYKLRYPQYQGKEIREVENRNFLYRISFTDGTYLQWFRYMDISVSECTELGITKG
jgi:hypothetical protein